MSGTDDRFIVVLGKTHQLCINVKAASALCTVAADLYTTRELYQLFCVLNKIMNLETVHPIP